MRAANWAGWRLAILGAMLGACSAQTRVAAHGDAPSARRVPRAASARTESTWLDQVGARVQATWSTFVDDARLRLPATHPLNDPRLLTGLDCVVSRDGTLDDLRIISSGNRDFDEAAAEILRDLAPFPPPPRAIVADDGSVHVLWQFTRTPSQSGLAAAQIARADWSLERALPALIGKNELGRAAHRLAVATPDRKDVARLTALAEAVFAAALREGLAADDVQTRRAAASAAEVTRSAAIGPQVRSKVVGAFDLQVRLNSIRAVASLGVASDAALIAPFLTRGPHETVELIDVSARAMVALGQGDQVVQLSLRWLDQPDRAHTPDRSAVAAALTALATVRAPQAVSAVLRQLASADPLTRARACAALAPSAETPGSWAGIMRGLVDRDATVRAGCAVAASDAGAVVGAPASASQRLLGMCRDRDERVRAAAIRAVGRLVPDRAAATLRALPLERSALVRTALATAWARVPRGEAGALMTLARDPDGAVRAAAVAALAGRPDEPEGMARAAAMTADPDARVRRASIAALVDLTQLARLSTDDDLEVRSAALDRDALLRGRAATLAARAQALADAPPASLDRVLIARSWLLAR